MKALITKLNKTTKKSLERAIGLCMSKGNYNVDLEHFLIQMIEDSQSDIQKILRFFEIDIQAVIKQLYTSIEKLPTGNTSSPAFSKHIAPILEQSWLFSSITLESLKIRSGAIIYTILTEDIFRGMILEICPLLLRIPKNDLKKDIENILSNSEEKIEKDEITKTDSNLQITTDLMNLASQEKLDPVFGREFEIRQLIHILSRRRQNNAILVGDSGVGKTAIVEGLVQKIMNKDVHPILLDTHIYSLNMSSLLSGTGTRGEFEKRLKALLNDLESKPHPSILFIDEAHMLLGAGGQQGVLDAANFLKPALARGTTRVIAATTWVEYKKYIEKDAALSRRFEKIQIKEPDFLKACQMLRLNAHKLEKHHGVTILNEAIESSVRFSQRFLPERRLPDKAIKVLDTACAIAKISQTDYPKEFKELSDSCLAFELEQKMLEKEQINNGKIELLKEKIKEQNIEKENIKNKWTEEFNYLQEFNLRKDNSQLKENSSSKTDKKFNFKFVQPNVTKKTVASIIHDWTGIPFETIMSQGGDVNILLNDLKEHIFGQDIGISKIANTIVQHQIGLFDLEKPIGVFFIIGPSGVGKTYTARILSKILTGSENNLLCLNMSEFQEPHSISKLKGAPPGYIGFGSGGTLTESVRQNPYSVILMDEIDKAHPDVLSIFMQIFDKGVLEDSEGLEVDFKHVLFVLTSQECDEIISNTMNSLKPTEDKNLVYDVILSKCANEIDDKYGSGFTSIVNLIPYLPLDNESITKIILKKLEKIEKNLEYEQQTKIEFSNELIESIVSCIVSNKNLQNTKTIDSYISSRILPKISSKLVTGEEGFLKI